MANQQDADELRVFSLFVESARLAVSPESIQKRQPPEPDIQCELSDHGCTCFELVEIVDSELARAFSNQLTFQRRLSDAAGQHGLTGLSDAFIFVSFAHASTAAQRIGAIPRLMALLQALPVGVRGDILLSANSVPIDAVRKVRVTRGEFIGPVFQVDAATFISDPVIERIDDKFRKTYATAHRLELLAFYELHPTQRAEYQLPAVEEFVRNNLQSSQFSRVWIFDTENRAVLYSS